MGRSGARELVKKSRHSPDVRYWDLEAGRIKLQDARDAGKVGPTEEPRWERCG